MELNPEDQKPFFTFVDDLKKVYLPHRKITTCFTKSNNEKTKIKKKLKVTRGYKELLKLKI